MTLHMTLTGPNAGHPLCGSDRNRDDDYTHAAYCSEDDDRLCPACLAVWNDDDDSYGYRIEAGLFGYIAWVTCNGQVTEYEVFSTTDYGGIDGSYAAAKAFLAVHGSPE